MLTIIVGILKVIGIVLLAILGILLILIIEALWVPVRYRIIAMKENDIVVKIKLHWLLHFLHISIVYENSKLIYWIRILGYRVYDSEKPKKAKQQKKDNSLKKSQKKKDKLVETNTSLLQDELKQEKETNDSNSGVCVAENTSNDDESQHTSTEEEMYVQEEVRDEAASQNHKSFGMKNRIIQIINMIRKIPSKVKKALKTVKETVVSIVKKVKQLLTYPSKLFALIKDESTKSSIGLIFQSIKKILKTSKPKKIRGHAIIGFDDPSTTGEVLGVISLVFAYFNLNTKKLQIIPDFTKQRLEGKLTAVGRIYLYTVLKVLVHLKNDKNMKQMKQRINQFKEES